MLTKRFASTLAGVVVGLGNPGPEYEKTRHNAGAMVVEELAARQGEKLKAGREMARTCRVAINGGEPVKLGLAIPASFMNECGEPVARILKYFKSAPESLIVVHDDLDLPLGTIRLKQGGGTGGHRGLDSIVKRLRTDEFIRVRIGIGRPPGSMDPADFVLRRFRKAERAEVELVIERSIDAVIEIVSRGIGAAMNQFN